MTKVFESYPVDGKYVNLQGFIDCVSSYSDPPIGTEEEIQETDDYYSNDNPVKMAYITDRSLLSQN